MRSEKSSLRIGPPKKVNKEYDQMNNREIDGEKARIEQIMMTKTLNKKEESDLNSKLHKLARAKQESNRPVSEVDKKEDQNIKDLEAEVSRVREIENKIKS